MLFSYIVLFFVCLIDHINVFIFNLFVKCSIVNYFFLFIELLLNNVYKILSLYQVLAGPWVDCTIGCRVLGRDLIFISRE